MHQGPLYPYVNMWLSLGPHMLYDRPGVDKGLSSLFRPGVDKGLSSLRAPIPHNSLPPPALRPPTPLRLGVDDVDSYEQLHTFVRTVALGSPVRLSEIEPPPCPHTLIDPPRVNGPTHSPPDCLIVCKGGGGRGEHHCACSQHVLFAYTL